MGGHFDGDIGLRVTYVGMKRPYVHLEEPSVDPLRQIFVSFTIFFTRAHARLICSFSRIHCTICLSQKILRGSERTFYRPERTLSRSHQMIFLSGFKGTSVCISRLSSESSESLGISGGAPSASRVLSLENPPSTEEAFCCRDDISADMRILCTCRPESALCMCAEPLPI